MVLIAARVPDDAFDLANDIDDGDDEDSGIDRDRGDGDDLATDDGFGGGGGNVRDPDPGCDGVLRGR